MASDGTYGFNSASNDAYSIKSSSMLGKILSSIGSNVTFTMTPVWKVGEDPRTTVEITLNLFNDTCDHALRNFLFVNTLIPQNMSLQYAVLRFPPCAYDIKIDGGRRLMMCSGKFTCMNKGVVREPSNLFFTKLSKHLNQDKKFYNEEKMNVD